MPDHEQLRGLNGLAAERATQLTFERATKKAEQDGQPVHVHVAMGILSHFREDMRAGLQFAKDAVAVMRSAPDHDPAVHGQTDDEIADHLLAAIRARRTQFHPTLKEA